MHKTNHCLISVLFRRPATVLAMALAIAGVVLVSAGCDTEEGEPTNPLPFSIETRAAAPPPEDLPTTTITVGLDSGETVDLVYTTITPPADLTVAPVEADDTVTVLFAAGLDRGPAGVEIYDSTEERNREFTFSLDDPGVIRGLREAIPGMRPGELRRIEIPWRLAYGETGRGEIPPSTDLVFAVELVSID